MCKETIRRWLRTIWLALVVLCSGLAWQAWADDATLLRHLRVNGVELSYSEQGTRAPVIFVPGAFSDLRIWEAQRQAIAQQYRFSAANQRYHDTAPWPDEVSTMPRPLPPIWRP
jgi:pimeloyl-ACP methyl ester carboxylesterase